MGLFICLFMAFGNAVGGAGKLSFKALTPYGRIAFYVTILFIVVLAVAGAVESVNRKSYYPFLENTVFRWVGSDHVIGKDVEALKNAPVFAENVKFLSKEWWGNFSPLWYRFSFWLDVILNLYFMFVIIYVFYKVFMTTNSSLPALNIIYAFVLFALLQLLVGLAFFGVNLDVYYPSVDFQDSVNVSYHAVVIPDNRIDLLNDMFGRSYPFEGSVSLVNHLFRGNLFDRTNEFEDSLAGKILMDVPDAGLNINDSGV